MADPRSPETRPQQGGEAETTRFGMEEGDTSEIPATGGPESWPESRAGEEKDEERGDEDENA